MSRLIRHDRITRSIKSKLRDDIANPVPKVSVPAPQITSAGFCHKDRAI